MANPYSCCAYVNRLSLLKLDLFYKQFSFNLNIFGGNEGDFIELYFNNIPLCILGPGFD